MKKIIYSLVIMIAAGSLFTSCIEQVEPLGIQDMRFAKAEYIRALKDLRAADAELVRAEAAHEQARARYVDAMTANLNADTEYQQLLNEYQQLINEARQDTNDFISAKTASAIDAIKKEIELRELQHAKAIAEAEKALAEAQEHLRVALRNIALSAQDLTKNEKDAVIAAVKAYKNAFEKTADQRIAVLKKQHELDSLKLYAQIGDTVYDKGSKAYIGQVEKYKKDIERNEAKQLVLAALLLAVPDSLDYEDVNAWQEQLEQLSADSAAVAYAQYQTKTEMASYYTNNIHDGVDYFNKVAEEWKKDNKRPTWNPDVDSVWIVKGEPKSTDSKYARVPDLQDSIAFTPFAYTKDITNATFNKFAYLLGSYNQASLLSASDPKNPIIKVKTKGENADTIFIVGPVSQKAQVKDKDLSGMKSFIMGAAGNGEGSQEYTYDGKKKTANYGLWGAYDILEREMVTAKKKASDTADLRKKMEKADSTWTTHRQILINGLAAYEPYSTAIAKYESDVAENGKGATAMVAAIATLRDKLDKVDGVNSFVNFTYNDSAAIFEALVEFAKARENYLEYDSTKTAHNYNYLRFATGKSSGQPIVDSVKFSAMTWDDFAAHKYDFGADGFAPATGTDVSDTSPLNQEDGLLNIASQLLGTGIAKKAFDYMHNSPAECLTKPGTDLDKSDFNGALALYGLYDIDGYVDPKPSKIYFPTATTTEYVPGNIKEDKDAIKEAVEGFVDVYNSFWNLSVTATMAAYEAATTGYYAVVESGAKADKIAEAKAAAEASIESKPATGLFIYNADDVKGYTLATFKPYADEAPIVAFTEVGTKYYVDTTVAMQAILTAVDPKSNGKEEQWANQRFEAATAIFNGGETDFWKFMKASYDYYMATNEKLVQDLAVVKEWIDGVETTFTTDAARTKAGASYANDKKAYDSAVARKPRIEDWRKKLQEFAGEGAYEMADIVKFTAPTEATSASKFESTDEVLIGNALEGLTPFGYYPGEWNKKLGGEQLVLAETLFPDYPEKFAEWYADIKDSQDEIKHYQILINSAKKAYTAAAKVAGENVGGADNWDELINNYTEANVAYRKRITDKIEELQNQIETWTESLAKFEAGKPAREIAIAEKAKELAVETAKLQNYEEALAYAKANLDRILEYVKSLDSNFVIPSSPDMYPANTTIW